MEVKISNVSYTYNEHTPFAKTSLENINFEIEHEHIVGIIGRSGSGKTTLAELLNALMLPSTGSIKTADFEIKRNMSLHNINSIRRHIGFVFQFPEEQFFSPTVRDEVSFALNYFKYKNERIQKQVSEALTMVGLDDSFLDKNVFQLSGGEKRKVAIASVLVFNPKILVLDEPTVGLDYKSKKKLVLLIKALKERYHKTIIVISHDISMLNILVDDLVVIDKGKVVMSGSREEVFNNATLFNKYNLKLPPIVEFINKAKTEKGIILGHHNDIKDLIKDIYRNV